MNFSPINFLPHPFLEDWSQAKVFFDNGYGVSVVVRSKDDARFLSYNGRYELAFLRGTEDDHTIFNDYRSWFEKNPELELYLYFNWPGGYSMFFSHIAFTFDQVEFITDVVKNVKP